MATKAQKAKGLKKAHARPSLTAGHYCWFTDPKDGSTHSGIYRGKRVVEEMIGFKHVTQPIPGGGERTAAFEEEIKSWTVPPSIVIHVGTKPVDEKE